MNRTVEGAAGRKFGMKTARTACKNHLIITVKTAQAGSNTNALAKMMRHLS